MELRLVSSLKTKFCTIFSLIFLTVFQTHEVTMTSSFERELKLKESMLCAHPEYPCYYFECTKMLLNEKKIFKKCPKGLIFDQEIQKCAWALPWKRCNGNEDNLIDLNANYVYSVSASTQAPVVETSDDTLMKNALFDKPSEYFLDNERNLMSLLSSITQPRTFQTENPSQQKNSSYENDENLTNKSEDKLNNFSRLFMKDLNIKVGSEFLYDDTNNSTQTTNSKQGEEEENGKETYRKYASDQQDFTDDTSEDETYDKDEDEPSESFAYVLVPIKIKNNNKKPKLKTNKIKNDKNIKNYNDIYKYKKVCYVTNWSQYRDQPAQFLPENIDPFLCTHIVYAFAYIDNVSFKIKTIEENDEDMYKRINDLKFKNPKLKTMLGIGGWNMESKDFSDMVKLKENREKFIVQAVNFLRIKGFDGIDIDWEFPGDRGGRPDDKFFFTKFIQEFRKAIDKESIDMNRDPLIFSAAVAAGKKRIDNAYEVKEIVRELDFINLMSFDFHGFWDHKTGLNAPLYSSENETGDNLQFNQDWSVSYWIKKGCPPHKIVLGLPAFGRTFSLMNKQENGILAKSFNNGTSGNFTKTPGFLAFYEICELKKLQNWTHVWTSQSKSNYMYRDNDWISFDDLKSFHLRTAYVVAKKLGGIFIWSIDMDDFSGKFCGQGSYPLIKNSMSLLMDYMPEFYSSNAKQPPKTPTKKTNKKPNKKPNKKKKPSSSSSKIFYILKDDQITSNLENAAVSSLEGSNQNFRLINNENGMKEIKQSNELLTSELTQIQNELTLLLNENPQQFFSFSLPDAFNCSQKPSGLHRDPFDCTKYYYCEESSDGSRSYFYANERTNDVKSTYWCPYGTAFNMQGCFCDKNMLKQSNCKYLSETYCDERLFKGINFNRKIFT